MEHDLRLLTWLVATGLAVAADARTYIIAAHVGPLRAQPVALPSLPQQTVVQRRLFSPTILPPASAVRSVRAI